MTKSTKNDLAYDTEYESTTKEKAKRAARGRARYAAMKKGLVHKGDRLQVDHIRPLDDGGSMSIKNTRVVSTKENEGWRKRTPKMYGKR